MDYYYYYYYYYKTYYTQGFVIQLFFTPFPYKDALNNIIVDNQIKY